jgi:hypothetical protein
MEPPLGSILYFFIFYTSSPLYGDFLFRLVSGKNLTSFFVLVYYFPIREDMRKEKAGRPRPMWKTQRAISPIPELGRPIPASFAFRAQNKDNSYATD